jgi:hypothetical protein
MRLALLKNAIDGVTHTTPACLANGTYNALLMQKLGDVLDIIDAVRTVAINNGDAIESAMDHGIEASFNGLLMTYLPYYKVGNTAIKPSVFIALSEALARLELPYIKLPATFEMSTPNLMDQVVVQVVDTLNKNDTNSILEPRNITIQDLGDMSPEEILVLDDKTMSRLLEEALESMESLYDEEISESNEDIWPSFAPTDLAHQITFWLGYIKGRLMTADTEHSWEFKIFSAFRALEHHRQFQIIDGMGRTDPLIEYVPSESNLQQSLGF